MTTDDLKQFRTVIKQEIASIIQEQISASEDRLKKHTKEQISASEDRLDKKLAASEDRSDKKLAALEERLKKHTTESVKQLSDDVGSFIGENLIPMIEEKADKSDIDRLERKLDRILDTSIDHETRIKDIERIPVIAHQLKAKKRK